LFKSNNQAGAGDAYHAIPTTSALRLSNMAMKIKMATTLGLSDVLETFAYNRKRECPSTACAKAAHPRNSHEDFGDQHIFNCPMRGGTSTRHNLLAKQVDQMIRSARIPTRYEPRATHPTMGKGGPDIEIRDYPGSSGDTVYVDIAIVNPIQSAYIRAACDLPLAAAARREKGKPWKYRHLTARTGREVFGAIAETTGAIGPYLQSLMSKVQVEFGLSQGRWNESPLYSWSASSFSSYWRQHFSVAVAKGNGIIANNILFRGPRNDPIPTPGPPAHLIASPSLSPSEDAISLSGSPLSE